MGLNPMQLRFIHRFDLSPREARAMQCELRRKLVIEQNTLAVQRIAGLDVGVDATNGMARAAVVVLSYPALEVIEEALACQSLQFPYVPGLLSFREIPPLLAALERIVSKPDVLMCDAHGLAHPRRFGLACHLGVLSGVPTIGVAKSKLIGKYRMPGEKKGSRSALKHDGERIGTVLRTRDGVKPVFVSIGHRISLKQAERITLNCAKRYRIPQPTRLADALASSRGHKHRGSPSAQRD